MRQNRTPTQWLEMMDRQRRSGQSARTWCEAQGIKYRTFLDQTRKARNKVSSAASGWVEVSEKTEPKPKIGEIRVEIGKFKMVVSPEFSETAFLRVCKALADIC